VKSEIGELKDARRTRGNRKIGNLRPYLSILAWPAVAVIVAILGWFMLLSNLDKQRQAQEETALREAAILSRAYANHLYKSLAAVDQISLYIKYAWEYSNGSFRLEGVDDAGLIPVKSGFFIAIFRPDGNMLTSVSPPANEVNASKEPFFAAQKNAVKDRFFISPVRFGVYSNRTVIQFSRQLVDRNGDFAGVVLVSAEPEYFVGGYDEVTLGKNGLLAVLGADKTVHITRVGEHVAPRGQSVLKAVPREVNEAPGTAFMPGNPWFSDSRSRFVGWQNTASYGMIALAGLDQKAAMASYSAHRSETLKYAAMASLALLASTLLAMLFAWRLISRKNQLKGLRAAYRVATEGGIEGFYIARPVFEANHAIRDFEVVDCNARGAGFLRRQREDLIGMQVSELFQAGPRDALLKMLRLAYGTGAFEGEEKQPRGSPVKWVYLRIVRTGDDLAVTTRDISDAKEHEVELVKRGNEDALTGLPNRNWVKDFLPSALRRAIQNETSLAVLFIDLDGFKAVNDTMGHEAGDEVLRHAGKRLKLAVRPNDHVVRIGGDEFVVILESAGDKGNVVHVAERILAAFQEKFHIFKGSHAVGTSIGISMFPSDGRDSDTLLKHADVAMYAAKSAGKRTYRFFEDKYFEAVRARHEKEADLRHAIEQDQIVIYYQPRIDVATGVMSGMEALARWMHPGKGIVEPLEFIPLAEETGLIVPLGELVIDKVCIQLAQWRRAGRPVVPVSINVSARQFNDAQIPALLARMTSRHNIDPSLIEIELTESCMADVKAPIAETLAEIQELGIKVLVDDFGTGYSSLSKLQELDVDVLKVDQSFTARLQKSQEGVALFKAIITMAHSLGMRVVAEGVERLDQLAMLKTLRCDEMQGFYVSRPLPAGTNQPFYENWENSAISPNDAYGEP
jgi:diguanylate cyclase